ncbi:MAG: SDR family oxidoreductase [Nitrospinae bacterium]|nr:SDR family oxidoreductase [Nitrospinota bacterium]
MKFSKLLKGKAALVTAASGERGAAIATALSREGCAVALHYYKNKATAEGLRDAIKDAGGRAASFQADLSRAEEVENLFSSVAAAMGPLQILVNNAHAEIVRRPFLETTWDDFQRQIDVTLKGSWLACSQFIRRMDKGAKGSIIQVLSAQLNDPVKGYTALASALSALAGFSKNLALEAGPLGVRVNSVAPGFTMGENTPHAPEWVREKIIQETPLGKLATPEDIGKAVVFFASDLSEFITGTCLAVDGGKS